MSHFGRITNHKIKEYINTTKRSNKSLNSLPFFGALLDVVLYLLTLVGDGSEMRIPEDSKIPYLYRAPAVV